MTRVLVAGESWISESTHHKGFDSFTTTTYHTGVDPLRDALSAEGIECVHLPAHEVPERFPARREDLDAYDAVILSDIGANSILLHPDTWLRSRPSVNRLALLAEWVEHGGGLAMAGGYLSFAGIEAKAAFRGTAVERVLPSDMSPYDDRVEVPEGAEARVVDETSPLVAGLDPQWPALLGYNRFTLKGDARLIATVNHDPLLAVREAGRGRTLVWASDIGPHWCPEEFLAWDGYRTLFSRAVRWLAGEL
ncbi:MAG: hypothetical protein JWL97_4024 [Gemmatimonadales bacterium]|jgi:uncharacterized membrane protein|nr:hypothetical protein [Gemmatimonadales bacterium]